MPAMPKGRSFRSTPVNGCAVLCYASALRVTGAPLQLLGLAFTDGQVCPPACSIQPNDSCRRDGQKKFAKRGKEIGRSGI